MRYLIIFLLLVAPALAFEAGINLYTDESSGYEKYLLNTSIRMQLNTGEVVGAQITDNLLSVDFEDKVFCYNGCNIVPERTGSYSRITHEDNPVYFDHPIFKEGFTITNIYIDEVSKGEDFEYNPYSNMSRIVYKGKIDAEEREYLFTLQGIGKVDVIINRERHTLENESSFELQEGENNITVEYVATEDDRPNLYIEGNELLFIEGTIQYVRKVAPMVGADSYVVDIEKYPITHLYFLHKESPDAKKEPTILVHGLHGSDKLYDGNWDPNWWLEIFGTYWGKLHNSMQDETLDVWEFYYAPANGSNFMNAGVLKSNIEEVLRYYDVKKVNIVAHSMGGLVTLGYISDLGITREGNQVFYGDNVEDIILIGSPLHGSHLSNLVINTQGKITECPTIPIITAILEPDDRDAQGYLDISVGSEFSWLLHHSPIYDKFDILTLAGAQGMPCAPKETNPELEAIGDNDGLVAVPSASLLNKGIPLIVLEGYNHPNEVGRSALPNEVTKAKEIHTVARMFFEDHSLDAIRTWVEDEGHTYIDPDGENPFTRGMVVLRVHDTPKMVYLKDGDVVYQLTKYTDRYGYKTYSWFYFSDDKDLPEDDPRYGLTVPAGVYDVYIDNLKTDYTIEVKPAQTAMLDIFRPYVKDKPIETENKTEENNTEVEEKTETINHAPVFYGPPTGNVVADKPVKVNWLWIILFVVVLSAIGFLIYRIFWR